MSRTPAEISTAIRAQLRILDPEISAEPLTPERKIIDTVAEVIAEAEADQYILNYQHDIDTKVGTDLDRFVGLFGFARQEGRRATGTVTFDRQLTATTDVFIPVGTQVVKPATTVSPTLAYFTTANTILYSGTLAADAPIQAAEVGELGNVAAGTITSLGIGTSTEISGLRNAVATSGGAAPESDADLRIRFKNTIFRNVSGTTDQYLALAIASRYSKKANVIGPISRFSEYLQVPQSLSVKSQIPYAKYTHTFDYYLTDGIPGAEAFYAPNGIDYTLTASNGGAQVTPRVPVAPTIAINNSVTLPVGQVILLEHTYTSISSRNDPWNNILNKVDIFVSGSDPITAVETCGFPSSANNVNTGTTTSAFYQKKYHRDVTGAYPASTSRLHPLIWQPVTILPTSIQIGTSTFVLNQDYWLVKDVSDWYGSRRARDGIEWGANVVAAISAGTNFPITYTFDRLPLELNELIDSHKQVTADALVHSARLRYFNVNVVIMYTAGFTPESVDAAITTTLISFMNQQSFGALIQLSDIAEIIHEVPGVDNVRIATANDGVSYGIQEYASNGTTLIGVPYLNDFALQDSDLPVLNNFVSTRRSQNTWSFS